MAGRRTIQNRSGTIKVGITRSGITYRRQAKRPRASHATTLSTEESAAAGHSRGGANYRAALLLGVLFLALVALSWALNR